MFEAEKQLIGITHAEISALLCEQWGVDHEIVRAIRFHHEPDSPFNQDTADLENQHFLATCICVADSMANICKANIQGARDLSGVQVESLPEWILLQQFTPITNLEIDLSEEMQKARRNMTGIFLENPARN